MKFFIILILLFNVSCYSNRISKEWKDVEINPTIRLEPTFKLLDSQLEVFDFNEIVDSSVAKSSGVEYVIEDLNFDISRTFTAKCNAFFDNDLLKIQTISSNGYGGEGFIIYYKKGKFLIKEAGYTDELSLKEPRQEILYQNLILEKKHYSENDSLYGYVDFKIEKTDLDNFKSLHIGKGYFRTVINSH